MIDRLKDVRRKSRFVVEIRYDTIPQILDMRGGLIAAVHPGITGKLDHWELHPDRIVLRNTREKSTVEYAIGIQRSAAIMEDAESLPDFLSRAYKFVAKVYDSAPKLFTTAARVGVRFITVQRSPEDTFEGVRERVLRLFHANPLRIPLAITDSQAIIVHEHGRFSIGPTKRDDEWIKQTFRAAEINVPDVGVAVDIDSYVKDWPIKDRASLLDGVKHVVALTTAMEEDIARAVGALDG